ncbi:MAG: NAD(P)H-dependent oxidoreductase [Candidatus Pacebacteria bacterium]|nr:NAD(P)H-dependent oxidoreductase [Candidatus Paceibacterota bacterium]
MNILIITAHPLQEGRTHTIANTYAEAKKIANHEVDIVDLYSEEYKSEPLQFTKDKVLTKIQKKFQEQLLWAHEIVIVHPVWWGTAPSVLKNWVDLTFWPNIAYRYNEKGKLEKLLTKKTAKVFVTCGGPSWYHHFPFMPLLSFWRTCVFEFCGVDFVTLEVCGNMNTLEGEAREKHFETFLKKIKKS